MALTIEQTDDLIEYLNGTCHKLDDATQSLFQIGENELSDENKEQIDDRIFECQTCSWWLENEQIALFDSGSCKSCCCEDGEDEEE